MVIYNENDLFAAQWLRNLITAGNIAPGTVDERDIQEVKPDDVREAIQFHAFAGIGGWSLALRLAGWPDDVGVWTGSCPCQPFSAAGKKEGFSDERHLWPEWRRLIATCEPATIFGEQVASPDGLLWFSRVRFDLEHIRYWRAYYEDLQRVRAAKTVERLSQILGEIAGRVEAALCEMPEELRGGLERQEQGAPSGNSEEAFSEGEAVPSGIRREEPWETFGHGSAETVWEEEDRVRSGQTRGRDRKTSSARLLRNDWPGFQLSFFGDCVEQPFLGSDRAEPWVYLPQHPSRVLWDERGFGKLGGEGTTHDSRKLVSKEWLSDERRIADGFGSVIEASVERLRLSSVPVEMEVFGYAVGAANLPAASIGAPQIRQRLFFVAYSVSAGRPERWTGTGERPFTGGLTTSIVADTKDADRRRAGIPADTRRRSEEVGGSGATCDMAHPKRDGRNKGSEMLCGREPKPSNSGGLGNAGGKRLEGRQGEQGDYGQKLTAIERTGNTTCPLADTGGSQRRTNPEGRGDVDNRTDTGWEEATGGHAMDSPYDGSWSDAEWLPCTDGKSRPVEPGTFPLAPSLPISMGRMQPELRQLAELDGLHTQSLTRAKGNRVGRLTGYGNSIVPQVASVFIRAFMEKP